MHWPLQIYARNSIFPFEINAAQWNRFQLEKNEEQKQNNKYTWTSTGNIESTYGIIWMNLYLPRTMVIIHNTYGFFADYQKCGQQTEKKNNNSFEISDQLFSIVYSKKKCRDRMKCSIYTSIYVHRTTALLVCWANILGPWAESYLVAWSDFTNI